MDLDGHSLLLALTLFSAGAYVALVALFVRGSRGRIRHDAPRMLPPPPASAPAVTILKPCAGRDDDLQDCLESFCRLNYPRYQLVLGVRDARDPAYPVLRAFQARHPEVDIEVVISAAGRSPNPKVANLEVMFTRARHDVLWVSDSNTYVHPDTLAAMVADLDRPGVGIVVSPVVGVGERRAGAALENLQLGAWAAMLTGAVFALTGRVAAPGKSALLRRRSLEAIGGFGELGRYCAEDHILVEKLRARGERAVLGRHLVANVNSRGSVRAFLARHHRWAQLRWLVALPTTLVEPLVSPVVPALALAAAYPDARSGLLLLAAAALQVVGDLGVLARLRGRALAPRHVALVWLRPLVQTWLWARAAVTRRVTWRGQVRWIGPQSTILSEPPLRARLRAIRDAVAR